MSSGSDNETKSPWFGDFLYNFSQK
jgi:hypothetical protein